MRIFYFAENDSGGEMKEGRHLSARGMKYRGILTRCHGDYSSSKSNPLGPREINNNMSGGEGSVDAPGTPTTAAAVMTLS